MSNSQQRGGVREDPTSWKEKKTASVKGSRRRRNKSRGISVEGYVGERVVFKLKHSPSSSCMAICNYY